MQQETDTDLVEALGEPGRALPDAVIVLAVEHAMAGITAADILAAESVERAGAAAWGWLTYWSVRMEQPLPRLDDARRFLGLLSAAF